MTGSGEGTRRRWGKAGRDNAREGCEGQPQPSGNRGGKARHPLPQVRLCRHLTQKQDRSAGAGLCEAYGRVQRQREENRGLASRPCGAQAGVGAPLAEHEAAGCRRAAGGMPALFKQHVNGLWPSRPRVIASGFGDNYFRNSWLFFFCAAVVSVQTDSVKERM